MDECVYMWDEWMLVDTCVMCGCLWICVVYGYVWIYGVCMDVDSYYIVQILTQTFV